ncbi:MAG: hypothetical protein BAA04_01360 [Firmicutes bacterium ZCTH02-B6]|nr:MAG: hypothetical protein BAA04_01360 [Firmicutes bacterium ZCTH02-B6]
MLIIFVRVVILYLTLLLFLRILGKRQVTTLQPYELVTLILFADVAAISMADTGTPLMNGVMGVFALLVVSFTVSYVTLKSARARAVISGRPTVVVANGKIVEDAMLELRYNVNDLLEQLRIGGYPNIQDVEFAVLETNGQLSIVPKSQHRPVTPADLGVATQYEGLPTPLIVDGEVDHRNLARIGLDMDWLRGQIRTHGVDDTRAVLYAAIDTQGRFYCQPRDGAVQGRGQTGERAEA